MAAQKARTLRVVGGFSESRGKERFVRSPKGEIRLRAWGVKLQIRRPVCFARTRGPEPVLRG
jgi:hypothetical protein